MRRIPSVLFVLTVSTVSSISAQVRASESALVAQTIDGTRLTVDYSRPRARTRDSLFGKVVTWGEVWTPGANQSTTLEVSKDVKLNGVPLAAGKYSVWFVVRKSGPWTMVLDPRNRLFHTAHPDSTAAQIRFPVTPQAAPFFEDLTWSFSEIHVAGVTLAMNWGTVRVPVDITVASSVVLAVPSDHATPLVGTYSVAWSGLPPAHLIVTYENGSLIGRLDPAPPPDFGVDRFYLIETSPGRFILGFIDHGTLYEVVRSLGFDFTITDGHATEFKVTTDGGQMLASGKRLP